MIIYNKIHGSEFQWNIAVLILIFATLVYIIPENCEYFILIWYSIPYRYSIFKKNPISFFPFIVQLRNFSLIFADNYYHIYILSKKEPGTIPLPLKSIYLRRFFEISPSSFLVFFLHFFSSLSSSTREYNFCYIYVCIRGEIDRRRLDRAILWNFTNHRYPGIPGSARRGTICAKREPAAVQNCF